MTHQARIRSAGALLAALVALGGCGGGGGGATAVSAAPAADLEPSATAAVPDGAAGSVDAFMAYLKGLSPDDETSEPATMDRFTPPADDAADDDTAG